MCPSLLEAGSGPTSAKRSFLVLVASVLGCHYDYVAICSGRKTSDRGEV